MSTTPQPEQKPAPVPTQTIVLQQPHVTMFGRYGKLLLVALVIAIFACIGMSASYNSYFGTADGPMERYHSLDKTATNKIAIINVTGTIAETNNFVKKQIDAVRADNTVKAVVLRINSPGGTVTYSDYLYHHINRLREERELPVVVSMGSLCASGGYYIAMAAGETEDVLFAERTTWTGSIGVIIPHYDFSGLLEKWNVADDSIASHELKDMGSPTKRMTEEERELLQALVDDTFDQFKEVVKSGRPAFVDSPEDLDAVATGQIFTAQQALDLGLVDKLGFIEDAIERAAELAGVSTESVRCVEFKPQPSVLGEVFGAANAKNPSIESLIELSAPRAYYISTFLPAVLENSR